MTFEFDSLDPPAQVDTDILRINPKDVINHLLLVWVIDYIDHSPTRFTQPGQKSDVIVVDAVDLNQDDPDTGRPGLLGRKCWWRQAQLIRDLKPSIGKPNPKLVFMTLGKATKGMPPFVLVDASNHPQAVQVAHDWRQRNPDFKPSEAGFNPNVAEAAAAAPVTLPPETELERLARLSQRPTAASSRPTLMYGDDRPGDRLPTPPRPPLPDEPPF